MGALCSNRILLLFCHVTLVIVECRPHLFELPVCIYLTLLYLIRGPFVDLKLSLLIVYKYEIHIDNPIKISSVNIIVETLTTCHMNCIIIINLCIVLFEAFISSPRLTFITWTGRLTSIHFLYVWRAGGQCLVYRIRM